jgi:16S rRNA (guanine966-N2)-methyltransferase
MRIISGLYKNRTIDSPKGLLTRPTSERLRGALFNICQTFIEGAEFLDLFAGSGAMGLEALSRGAQRATFLDSNREALRSIKKNVEQFHCADKAVILNGDVFIWLEKLNKQNFQYDIIYADPPYDMKIEWQGNPMSFSDCVMKIVDESHLLKKGGVLFVEDSASSHSPTHELKTLQLKDSRRIGHSVLHQYQLL